ncbi:putative peroxidase [Helianthus annuus]|uniref:Peroxidase n=1 Tax=Helianthus annuus TaxID=4232 RepID=A0A251TG61_HELAN|nr:peroxidase 12 [Helianthus annuus]KAF5784669.1 putative peroxidase [Helianthus annuus]KAJ0512355.1 putative peroxidase [Helianthus annuus]KAJ0528455.1 putative peroxidase [Helianthus annuus]KAJ0695398.1 putative peroxidase [Helianthus annuus]KAJ0882103.1 putative peroxidase [Helianthus annuus]
MFMAFFFKASSIPTLIFLLLSCNLIRISETQTPAPAPGLSYDFYRTRCPRLETIIRQNLQSVFASDIGQAAGLLRLHFHDCFVQGCDGSVLLDGSASGPSEKDAPPNLSLRAQAFVIIENLRRLVHNACNRTVSCSDITALAARDAVFLSGGPNYSIPLGRRDGLTFATRNVTLANLPPPSANTTTLLNSLGQKGFTPTDVVALSGGHTIGIAHCTSFTGRLYPTRDPTMDQTFFNNLRTTCPTTNSTNTTFMDIRSPNVFDNRYYVDLMNRQGLFTSDQDLYTDSRTRSIVTNFAVNQTLFYQNFVNAMIKMGQLSVLTGTQGEIRSNCSRRNSNDLFMFPDMESDQDGKLASY